MITIGIIDDNAEQRDSFKDAIEIYLHKNNRSEIAVVDSEPLQNIEDYASWINQNDIAALIIDEKLADMPLTATGVSCGYEGHDMAKDLRDKSSVIPIHVVTSATTNDELKENRQLFESVLSRKEFLDNQEQFSEVFIRSAQRYYEENRLLFERIAELSKKLVLDSNSTAEDLKELEGIQQYIQTPLVTQEMVLRQNLIESFKQDLEELRQINDEAKEFLKS